MGISNPVHLAFVAIVALLVLGPKRLPDLARSLGSGMREFRESLNSAMHGDEPELSRTVVEPIPAAPVEPAATVEQTDPPATAPVATAPVATAPVATAREPTAPEGSGGDAAHAAPPQPAAPAAEAGPQPTQV